MKIHQRCSAALLLAITLSTALLAGCGRTASPVSPTVVGKWNVTYGAPVIVSVELTGTDAYSMTAANPVTLTGGSPCQLPVGTTIATFSGRGASYTGQHGLWNTSNCSFARWTTLRLALNGNTAIANLGTGGILDLTRMPVAVTAKEHPTGWLWLVLIVFPVSLIAYLLVRRRRRGSGSATQSPSTNA